MQGATWRPRSVHPYPNVLSSNKLHTYKTKRISLRAFRPRNVYLQEEVNRQISLPTTEDLTLPFPSAKPTLSSMVEQLLIC
jgi:hypothetical protein